MTYAGPWEAGKQRQGQVSQSSGSRWAINRCCESGLCPAESGPVRASVNKATDALLVNAPAGLLGHGNGK